MSPDVVAAIIAASVSFLTLIGTLAAQYFGRRATSRDTQKALEEQGKQLDRTLAEQRTRTLNERFATAAEQLGSDKPAAVQLAGLYAMAGLADDWEENRQTCVDVLCAYLRLPYRPDPGAKDSTYEQLAFRASREVRHTVIRVITARLRDGAPVSWRDLSFDFTGAIFDGADFSSAMFSGGQVSFTSATFSGGRVDFTGATFSGGRVDFTRAKFSGGRVDFTRATFSGGRVDFTRATFSGGTVDFTGATFSGGLVYFGATFSSGTVNFAYATFSGADVGFRDATFSGSKIDFTGATFSRGKVWFGRAMFSGGTVNFAFAAFSGSKVGFGRAAFSGGTIDFTNVAKWSCPPTFDFDWDNPPSEVKLSAAVHEESQ